MMHFGTVPGNQWSIPRRRFATLVLAAGAFGLAGSASAKELSKLSQVQPFFSFRSDFWLNLHHFLYQHGEYRKYLTEAGLPADRIHNYRQVLAEINTLPLAQRQIWNSAVEEYQNHWAGKDLLFDDGLFGIKMALIATPDLRNPQKPALPENIYQSLSTTAPIYRKVWWPGHHRQNRTWVSNLMPGLQKYGAAIQKRLLDIYQQPWPIRGHVPVELVPYARRFNAYTTDTPVVIVISSRPTDISGWAALETVFHEVSHGIFNKEGPILTTLTALCKEQNVPVPEGFEHALLFYTTSEVVRQELARDGIIYKPFWVPKFYERVGWTNYHNVLKEFWQSYLDGQSAMKPAVEKIFAGLQSKRA